MGEVMTSPTKTKKSYKVSEKGGWGHSQSGTQVSLLFEALSILGLRASHASLSTIGLRGGGREGVVR